VADNVCECQNYTKEGGLSIKPFVTVYLIKRDEDGELVKRNKTEYRRERFGKYQLYDRPPMMYIEAEFGGGGKVTVACQRTGEDEYTEHIKKGEEDEEA
jgi:hypothetical protein